VREAPPIRRTPRPPPGACPGRRRWLRHGAALALAPWAAAAGAQASSPSPPAVVSLDVRRGDDAVLVGFAVRFELSRPVEEALMKGVPLHFTAVADLYRSRWYWTDRRVASASRTWRLAFLPLTRQFRVSFGGLTQNFDELDEALASVSRASGWRIADDGAVEDDSRHYVELSYRLDISLLPRPMQIGLVGQPDWTLELRRSERLA
jgi:hypothetical protein